MSTYGKILLAVANGARNTRQIARATGSTPGIVKNFFYGEKAQFFPDGEMIRWQPGVVSSFVLGPRAAVIRRNGKAVAVGRAEPVQ